MNLVRIDANDGACDVWYQSPDVLASGHDTGILLTVFFVHALDLPHILATWPADDVEVGLVKARGSRDLGAGKSGQRVEVDTVDGQGDQVSYRCPEGIEVHGE